MPRYELRHEMLRAGGEEPVRVRQCGEPQMRAEIGFVAPPDALVRESSRTPTGRGARRRWRGIAHGRGHVLRLSPERPDRSDHGWLRLVGDRRVFAPHPITSVAAGLAHLGLAPLERDRQLTEPQSRPIEWVGMTLAAPAVPRTGILLAADREPRRSCPRCDNRRTPRPTGAPGIRRRRRFAGWTLAIELREHRVDGLHERHTAVPVRSAQRAGRPTERGGDDGVG